MQEPFFATLFTLSSHHPFVVPEQYADKAAGGNDKIHKPVAYEDLAFRNFYRRFKDEGSGSAGQSSSSSRTTFPRRKMAE